MRIGYYAAVAVYAHARRFVLTGLEYHLAGGPIGVGVLFLIIAATFVHLCRRFSSVGRPLLLHANVFRRELANILVASVRFLLLLLSEKPRPVSWPEDENDWNFPEDELGKPLCQSREVVNERTV